MTENAENMNDLIRAEDKNRVSNNQFHAKNDIWYYAEGEKPIGPIGFEHLGSLLSHVSDPSCVLVWCPDFDDWKKAKDVPELRSIITKPPPIRLHNNALSSTRVTTPTPEQRKPDPLLIADSRHVHTLAASPKYLLKKATVASALIAVLWIIFSGCLLWRIYLLSEVGRLVEEYGFGHVPKSEIPSGLDIVDTWTFALSLIWQIGILSCVFYCFYQIYVVIRTQNRKELKYGFGWTVGSIFIPFINFYRPWVGLGEIRRVTFEERFGFAKGFDVFTLWFGIVWCLGIFALRLVAAEQDGLGKNAIDNVYFGKAVGLDMVYGAIATIITATALLFCRSVVVNCREAMSERVRPTFE